MFRVNVPVPILIYIRLLVVELKHTDTHYSNKAQYKRTDIRNIRVQSSYRLQDHAKSQSPSRPQRFSLFER